MSRELLKELGSTIESIEPKDVPPWIYRYYRKLAVHCLRSNYVMTSENSREKHCQHDCIIIEKPLSLKPFVTPYTLRTLKPFILVDRESEPLRIKMLSDICQRQGRKYKRHPIVYKYIQKHHVRSINQLCHVHFWPGIDITEALEFPEFSVVAEYNRIVVGFGFLVPDVSHSDAYISFIFTLPGWRRAGIARLAEGRISHYTYRPPTAQPCSYINYLPLNLRSLFRIFTINSFQRNQGNADMHFFLGSVNRENFVLNLCLEIHNKLMYKLECLIIIIILWHSHCFEGILTQNKINKKLNI